MCASFVLKNPEFRLVHGVVSSLDRSDMPYAWVAKDSKVYDVVNDRWVESSEWSNQTVERITYSYTEVERLVAYTGHPGPWSKQENDLSLSATSTSN